MPGVLSSDVLERQFGGSTRLEILSQNGHERIICTSLARNGKVLELSKVVFRTEGIGAFPAIHREIVSGKSMGKAFAGAAVRFDRRVHASCRYDRQDLPAVFGQRFGAATAPTVTNLSIVVGPDNVPYADILEVYSPDVTPWELGSETTDEVSARLLAFGAELSALSQNP